MLRSGVTIRVPVEAAFCAARHETQTEASRPVRVSERGNAADVGGGAIEERDFGAGRA